MKATLRASLMLLGLLAGLPPAARAAETPGGVAISPVRVDLAAQQHAAAVTISNPGGAERMIQVEPMQWSHPDGTDHYEPATELVVNPPLFRLKPGGSQVVRVGLARQVKPDDKIEKDFRIFFQELPKGGAGEESQLQILLRIGVPVFVKPLAPAVPALRWQLARAAGGKLQLQVHNDGAMHERVSGLSLRAADGSAYADIEGFAYVLPGQDRHWDVVPREGAAPAGLRLRAVTEGGAIDAELSLPAP